MKKHFIRSLLLIMCLICALSAFSTTVYAIDPIDLQADVSVILSFKYEENPIPNTEFSLYRIADTTEWVEFTACGDFEGYTGNINGFETASQWDDAASDLIKYIADNEIKPLCKATTDKNGEAYFGKEMFDGEMKPGLYLIICGETEFGDSLYTAIPALVCLPSRLPSSDEWIYENTPLKVKPGEPKPVPEPPKPVPPNLPQTGMLWWPVFVLMITGMIFIIIGMTRRRAYINEK